MVLKATTKKLPLKKKEVVILHECTKETEIESMDKKLDLLGVFLTGNGNPDNGLLRKVAIIGERQHETITKLEDVHLSLKEYHKEVDEAKDAALKAQHALEEYRAVIKTAEETKDKERQESRAKILKNIEVGSFIVAAIGLLITAYFSFHGSVQSEKNSKMIDNLGTPVIVNPRGEVTPLPDGDSLKFFRDGTLKDTMR
jgi:hypothetical protein